MHLSCHVQSDPLSDIYRSLSHNDSHLIYIPVPRSHIPTFLTSYRGLWITANTHKHTHCPCETSGGSRYHWPPWSRGRDNTSSLELHNKKSFCMVINNNDHQNGIHTTSQWVFLEKVGGVFKFSRMIEIFRGLLTEKGQIFCIVRSEKVRHWNPHCAYPHKHARTQVPWDPSSHNCFCRLSSRSSIFSMLAEAGRVFCKPPCSCVPRLVCIGVGKVVSKACKLDCSADCVPVCMALPKLDCSCPWRFVWRVPTNPLCMGACMDEPVWAMGVSRRGCRFWGWLWVAMLGPEELSSWGGSEKQKRELWKTKTPAMEPPLAS